jgi:serine/threonine protein phosphatase PrpC
MLDTINKTLNSAPTTPPSPEIRIRFEYVTSITAQESSKPTENQDVILPRFVADGISQFEDSLEDSRAVAEIFTRLFGSNITAIPKNQLNCKLAAFRTHIQNYLKENNLKKIRTTISFVTPFIEDEQEKLCIYSQGDSVVLGQNLDGECKQLNLNSHPLFENISKLNMPEMTKYAIKMQQIVRDSNIRYHTNKDKAAFISSSMMNINRDEGYDQFLKFMSVSASKMVLSPNQLEQKKSDLVNLESIVNPDREEQTQIKKLRKTISLAPTLQQFIDTKEIRYLVEAYILTMNVVSDFHTVTYQNSKDYKYIIVASDGLSDNLTSKAISNILETVTEIDPKKRLNAKNQTLVEHARKARVKKDHISSCLFEIKQK